MIIDRIKAFFFNPIEKKAKKESDADAVRSLIDELQKTKRTSYTVRKQIAAELQQQKLREAISYSQQAPWYYYYELLEMLRQVELDGHLKAVMNQRINSALSESWTVSGKNADIFKQKWFLDYMRIAIESVFWGFSVASITIEKGKIKIAKIDRSYINPEFQTFLTNPNVRNSAGIPLDSFSDAQFIKHDADEVCLLAVAARYTIWKNFSSSDWSRYSERFGMPIIVAKTETTNQSELNEMAKMLTNMGANGWAILDKRDEFTFAEASKTDAHNVYLEFIRLLNEELSKIIVGQILLR
jgi:phage gp29-like protein